MEDSIRTMITPRPVNSGIKLIAVFNPAPCLSWRCSCPLIKGQDDSWYHFRAQLGPSHQHAATDAKAFFKSSVIQFCWCHLRPYTVSKNQARFSLCCDVCSRFSFSLFGHIFTHTIRLTNHGSWASSSDILVCGTIDPSLYAKVFNAKNPHWRGMFCQKVFVCLQPLLSCPHVTMTQLKSP